MTVLPLLSGVVFHFGGYPAHNVFSFTKKLEDCPRRLSMLAGPQYNLFFGFAAETIH